MNVAIYLIYSRVLATFMNVTIDLTYSRILKTRPKPLINVAIDLTYSRIFKMQLWLKSIVAFHKNVAIG